MWTGNSLITTHQKYSTNNRLLPGHLLQLVSRYVLLTTIVLHLEEEDQLIVVTMNTRSLLDLIDQGLLRCSHAVIQIEILFNGFDLQ